MPAESSDLAELGVVCHDDEQADAQSMQKLTTGKNYHTFAPATTPSSGKLVVEWYLSLFSALSTLGTLGAGFTLSVVVQASTQRNAADFPPVLVNTWAAISSLLFITTVLVCQGCSQIFKFEQSSIVEGIEADEQVVRWSLAALSLLLQMQVLGAFLFLELVITAHSPQAGWVGVSCTLVLATIALSLWGLQVAGREPVTRLRGLASNGHRYPTCRG